MLSLQEYSWGHCSDPWNSSRRSRKKQGAASCEREEHSTSLSQVLRIHVGKEREGIKGKHGHTRLQWNPAQHRNQRKKGHDPALPPGTASLSSASSLVLSLTLSTLSRALSNLSSHNQHTSKCREPLEQGRPYGLAGLSQCLAPATDTTITSPIFPSGNV